MGHEGDCKDTYLFLPSPLQKSPLRILDIGAMTQKGMGFEIMLWIRESPGRDINMKLLPWPGSPEKAIAKLL